MIALYKIFKAFKMAIKNIKNLFGTQKEIGNTFFRTPDAQVVTIAGAPTESFGEGAMVVNMAENRLYVQVTGADTQPILHYKLNETGGTTVSDSGSGGHTGTASSAANWTTGYYQGGFDGSDQYILADGSSDFNFGGSFTLMCWIKPNELTTGEQFIFSRAKDNNPVASGEFYILEIGQNPSMFYFQITGTGTNSIEIPSIGNLGIGVWTHIAIVGDRGTGELRGYVNGILKQTVALTASPAFNAGTGDKFVISEYPTITGVNGFNGDIDEIKVFNSARTSTQIANDSLKSGGLVWSYATLTGV